MAMKVQSVSDKNNFLKKRIECFGQIQFSFLKRFLLVITDD